MSSRRYDTTNLPYSDAARDRATAVSVSVLTQAGVLEGNPDGTFRPLRPIDRAQFVKIVMEMLRRGLVDNTTVPNAGTDCFNDVPTNAWYAPYVCQAKAMGMVRGDAMPNVAMEFWRFNPGRNINYAEAVKVLSEAFGHDVTPGNGDRWYVPYLDHAEDLGIDLSGVRPGDFITRGEMSRLAVLFLAYQDDELDDLQNAIDRSSSSSSRSSSSSSRSSSSSSRSSSSSSSSTPSGTVDTMSDTTARSQFVLLGEVSPMLGAANFLSSAEPVQVKRLSVNLASANPNLESILFYDDSRRLIGRGFLDTTVSGNTRYTLNVPSGRFTLPEDDEVSVYVRGDFRTADEGGTTNADLQIVNFRVEGTGGFSSDDYTAVSSGQAYPVFLTTPAMITAVRNAGASSDILTAGVDRRIGAFTFDSRRTDTTDVFRLDDITFQISQTGNVSLSDVEIGVDGTSERHGCSVVGSTIVCSNLPTTIGALAGGSKTLVLYADVTVPGSSTNASLRVSITGAGSSSTAGDITWISGTTSFTWVPALVNAVDGTNYTR